MNKDPKSIVMRLDRWCAGLCIGLLIIVFWHWFGPEHMVPFWPTEVKWGVGILFFLIGLMGGTVEEVTTEVNKLFLEEMKQKEEISFQYVELCQRHNLPLNNRDSVYHAMNWLARRCLEAHLLVVNAQKAEDFDPGGEGYKALLAAFESRAAEYWEYSAWLAGAAERPEKQSWKLDLPPLLDPSQTKAA